MPINSIAYNEKLTEELDRALTQRSVTGILADNALATKFVGAKTVLIPDVTMQGLGDYNRDTGFSQGSIAVTHNTYTLSQDRGRSFQIDAEEADESGVSDLIGKVAGEFLRTQVIPEMDAYVLSKLGRLAQSESQTVIGNIASEGYTLLTNAIHKVQDAAGFDEELVAFVSSDFWENLQLSPEIQRVMVTNDVNRGDFVTRVASVNGVPIIPVMNNRMKTYFDFKNGVVGGTESEGGFAPSEVAESIHFIVMPKRAAALVKKTEKTRVFSPAENQNADAWKMDYRVYYDLFIKVNYANTIYAYIGS